MKALKTLPIEGRRTTLGLMLALSLGGCATQAVSPSEPHRLVADAQSILSNFLRDPDQTWIQDNLGRAKAVMIAPQIVRAGFIFGGSGGRAVLAAREGRTWAGPAFYNLATASVGFQAGLDVSEGVIVVMTDKGLNSLLASTNIPWNDAFFGKSNLLPPDNLIRRTRTSAQAAGSLADVAKATK